MGLIEYHWENLDGKNPQHEKRWVLDMFVPGSAEIMMMHPDLPDKDPRVANFFERMAYLPLVGVTELVPPGGAGIGMHVIPVEQAIPAESKSLDIEHISHWLDKYDGQLVVGVCSCRKQQRIRGEGSGDVEGDWCIGVGDFADYMLETGKARKITREEALEILRLGRGARLCAPGDEHRRRGEDLRHLQLRRGRLQRPAHLAALQHAKHVRQRLCGGERPGKVRRLRQMRGDLPRGRGAARAEALHHVRAGRVPAPRAARRHEVGRGALEQEL